MEEINITNKMLMTCCEKLNNMPVFQGSHKGIAANEIGVMGEVVVECWMNAHGISFSDHTHQTKYDYLLAGGRTMDVKTKTRAVAPKTNYECSVPTYNKPHQNPDYYMFVSLIEDRELDGLIRFNRAYLLGGCSQRQLKHFGHIRKKGDKEDNGIEFWTDCINIGIANLASLDKIADVFYNLGGSNDNSN